MKSIKVHKNRYVDSVTLMSIGDKVMSLSGISNAEVQMGTPANTEVLEELGYVLSSDIKPDDLVFAVTGQTQEKIEEAFKFAESLLSGGGTMAGQRKYHDIGDIDLSADPYDIAQISLPGEYVLHEAKKALLIGMDLFIFSDNVPLEQELELKELGREMGRLVMGPDCGVGFINGVCLGAGSIMREGSIGIIAASGSGAQEVGSIIEKYGHGISNIIGTGGRDLYPEINGIEMLQAMKLMAEDNNTKVIVLVSKLAGLGVMNKILTEADKIQKAVVAIFLGSEKSLFEGHNVIPAFSLHEAAEKACKLISEDVVDLHLSKKDLQETAQSEYSRYDSNQKYFRGLFCGGTFTEEALIYLNENLSGVNLNSNLKTRFADKLRDRHISLGHTILDLGAEDFTSEAPHPVFDPKLRAKRLEKEIGDPETAAILLDFITGPGVAQDPFSLVIETIKKDMSNTGKHITYIANICGTEQDPQNIRENIRKLKECGVIVTQSNYESIRLAGAIINKLEKGAQNG